MGLNVPGTTARFIMHPSIGASAILTNMFTMKSNILSYAKVRLSYSEVGNAPERFRAITTYAVLGGLNTTSYFPIKGYNMEEWFVPAKADIQSLRNEPST